MPLPETQENDHCLANKPVANSYTNILSCKLYGTPQTKDFIVMYSVYIN